MPFISLPDAITITGATSGQVLSEANVNVRSLTGAQKTALAAFITSLGPAWPGPPANIVSLSIDHEGPGSVACTLHGVVVHATAAGALAALNAGATSHVIGQA